MESQYANSLICLGGIFILYGIAGIFRRKINLRFGSGIFSSQIPFLGVKFKGAWAVAFGITVSVGGSVISLTAIFYKISQKTGINDLTLTLGLIVGLSMIGIGFMFCSIMQSAIKLGHDLKENKIKDDNQT